MANLTGLIFGALVLAPLCYIQGKAATYTAENLLRKTNQRIKAENERLRAMRRIAANSLN